MADLREPGGSRVSLAEGAQRFDRVVRTVKSNQLAGTKARTGVPEPDTAASSPDEAWARKYTTRCIGPVCFQVPAEASPFAKYAMGLAKPAETQAFSPPAAPPRRRETAEAGPIGLAIGKPARRSWVGRLFGR